MSLPNWTPPLTKLRVYEAVYFLNRSFEATTNAVDRLESLEFFANDYLTALKTQVEYLRAEANSHLADSLQEYEENETFRLDEIKREHEKELSDPDDVFFAARDREKEIKEKIKELQGGLARKRPKHKSRKARKKGKKQV
jgi:uncharacterized membrane protein YqiK